MSMMPRVRLSLPIVIGCCVILMGCDSFSASEQDEPSPIRFELNGSLNTSFEASDAQYEGQARLVQVGSEYRLDVQLSARSQTVDEQEAGHLVFRLPVEPENGGVQPGNYLLTAEEGQRDIGTASYAYSQGDTQHIRHAFIGTSLRLQIEESEAGRLVGRYSLELVQQNGERRQDGQLEEVVLAGPARALGQLNLQLEVLVEE